MTMTEAEIYEVIHRIMASNDEDLKATLRLTIASWQRIISAETWLALLDDEHDEADLKRPANDRDSSH